MKFKNILIVIFVIFIATILMATIDYNRAMKGNKPLIVFRTNNIYYETIKVATEYYSLGYKITLCHNYCIKDYKISLFTGTYAWFIDDNLDSEFEISIKEQDPKKDEVKLNKIADEYYQAGDLIKSKIYTYGLESIKITIDDDTYNLKDALANSYISIRTITTQLNSEDILYDGGTTIYRDNGEKQVANGNLTIIVCNSVTNIDDYNNDIYIGNKDLVKEESFCQ